jgi:hypothetical protein
MPRKSKSESSTSKTGKGKKSSSQRSASRSSSERDSGSHLSKTTTNHEEIRRWAEQRGGVPACVQGTGGGDDVGIIRLEFPGTPGNRESSLEEISWDEFFEKFDEGNLALVYQEKTADGKKSNCNQLVRREKARGAAAGR